MVKAWNVADRRAGHLFTAERMFGGFTAKEISFLCDSDGARSERRQYSPFPWVYWGSEHYSFGRCYREVSGYPRWLPIAVNSDHGVGEAQSLLETEKTAGARVHLVWSAWRVGYWNNEKEFHRTLHPWVGFRRLRGLGPKPSAQGTLVFLPHSLPGVDPYIDDGWEELIDKSKRLPPDFQPVVFCIQMHDVNKGSHESLLASGLPVVTFGESTGPFFVERFYSGIFNFRYSASNSVGSHTFICQEAGVDFFLLGDPYERDAAVSAGVLGQSLETYSHEFESQVRWRKDYLHGVFSNFPPEKSMAKSMLMRDALGLDFTVRDAGKGLRILLWAQLLANWHVIFSVYVKKLWSSKAIFGEKLFPR